MRIGKFRVRRKALSPVIATLLMVAIAVAAAIITYVWSMGLLGGLMGTGGSQTKEQLIVESYNWNGTQLSFVVRNVGSANVQVASVYLEGNSQSAGTPTINVGATASLIVSSPSGTFTNGAAYVLKIVTSTGGTFSFSVVKGRAG